MLRCGACSICLPLPSALHDPVGGPLPFLRDAATAPAMLSRHASTTIGDGLCARGRYPLALDPENPFTPVRDGPYGLQGEKHLWAQPDADQLAGLLRRVYEQPQEAAAIGMQVSSAFRIEGMPLPRARRGHPPVLEAGAAVRAAMAAGQRKM